MRRKFLEFLHQVGLYDISRWLYTRSMMFLWRLYGLITNRNERVFERYRQHISQHKLHLGCGLNYLDGWLNTDISPDGQRIYLDTTREFTFPDHSFDHVFSEHVIEHMPYLDGKTMIEQSFRVLKSGGVFRLVTPDINFLIGLYQNDQKKLHQDYIAWNSELFIQGKAPHCALSVFNNYVRDWGHQYIYDESVLRGALEDAGFTDIRKCELGESKHVALKGLENAERHPEGFLALESLVLEATKP